MYEMDVFSFNGNILVLSDIIILKRRPRIMYYQDQARSKKRMEDIRRAGADKKR